MCRAVWTMAPAATATTTTTTVAVAAATAAAPALALPLAAPVCMRWECMPCIKAYMFRWALPFLTLLNFAATAYVGVSDCGERASTLKGYVGTSVFIAWPAFLAGASVCVTSRQRAIRDSAISCALVFIVSWWAWGMWIRLVWWRQYGQDCDEGCVVTVDVFVAQQVAEALLLLVIFLFYKPPAPPVIYFNTV